MDLQLDITKTKQSLLEETVKNPTLTLKVDQNEYLKALTHPC